MYIYSYIHEYIYIHKCDLYTSIYQHTRIYLYLSVFVYTYTYNIHILCHKFNQCKCAQVHKHEARPLLNRAPAGHFSQKSH